MKWLALALLLIGCGSESNRPGEVNMGFARLYEKPFELTDGRKVVCIVYAGGYKGGLSCDWENAR